MLKTEMPKVSAVTVVSGSVPTVAVSDDASAVRLESSLSAGTFYRANRQSIVSVNSIGEMQAHSRSRLNLLLRPASPHDVIVSTDKASAFKAWLRGGMS